MPKRFFEYSRTEPARTTIFCVALLSIAFQSLTLLPIVTPFDLFWSQAVNVAIVAVPSILSVRASYRNSVPGMARWSFWLFIIWLWSGLSRLAFSPDWALLLWAPMLIVAVVLAIAHIYMKGMQKGRVPGVKVGGDEE